MHAPTCVTPLAGDYSMMIAEGDAYGSARLAIPFEFRGMVVNGWVYYVSRYDVPDDELEATRARATALSREQVPLTAAYWRRAVDELREIWGWIASLPVEDLSDAELADVWEEAWRRALRTWQIHFFVIIGPYEVMDMLADAYESVVTDAPPGEALRLTQGTIHELTDVDAGLTRLADLAAANPSLAEAMSGGRTVSVDDLARVPGAQSFLAELAAFLDRHGHLGQSWDDLALPSWAEEPSRLLTELAKRLDHPPSRQETGQRASRQRPTRWRQYSAPVP